MKRRAARWLAGAAIGLVLAATFAAYLRPETIIGLATQLWRCF